jgi:hypothetical protein
MAKLLAHFASLTPWRRHLCLLAVASVAAVVLSYPVWGFRTDVGRSWEREADFMADQSAEGWRWMGRFGTVQFPAEIVARTGGQGGIVFTDLNGLKHKYEGFGKQPFKALWFERKSEPKGRFILVMSKPETR